MVYYFLKVFKYLFLILLLYFLVDYNYVFINYFRYIFYIIFMIKLKIRYNVIIFLFDNRKKYFVVSVFLERCFNRIFFKIFFLFRVIVRWSKLNVRVRI